jgi:glucose-6-phosphate 1-epimerase
MPVSVQQDRVVAVHGQSELEVMNYGATITSWKFNGQEKLFVSSKAVLDQSKAIRGGMYLRLI